MNSPSVLVLLARSAPCRARLAEPEVEQLVAAAAPVQPLAAADVVPERQQKPPHRDQWPMNRP